MYLDKLQQILDYKNLAKRLKSSLGLSHDTSL